MRILHHTCAAKSLQFKTMAEETDEELMLRVRGGDHAAFALLYERQKARLLQFCIQMLRNTEDASDVFQEAFRYLFTHASTYEPRAKFTTYLYRIARNMCIDILRRRRRWNLQSLDPAVDFPDPEPGRETKLELEEVEVNIRAAMDDVPEPYREVVILRVIHGMEYHQVAEVVDAPLGTVKSRLHVGLEVLRQALRKRKLAE